MSKPKIKGTGLSEANLMLLANISEVDIADSKKNTHATLKPFVNATKKIKKF
jgi:hypothetical protein